MDIMNLFSLLFLPTICSASFFDNFTNMVTYSYPVENCSVKPAYVNVSDTVWCLPFQNISMCCKDLMKQNNYDGPLNLCYNKDDKSSFTSCYEERLTQAETNSLGALAVFGIIFFFFVSISCVYMLFSCMSSNSYSSLNIRNQDYKSLNK